MQRVSPLLVLLATTLLATSLVTRPTASPGRPIPQTSAPSGTEFPLQVYADQIGAIPEEERATVEAVVELAGLTSWTGLRMGTDLWVYGLDPHHPQRITIVHVPRAVPAMSVVVARFTPDPLWPEAVTALAIDPTRARLWVTTRPLPLTEYDRDLPPVSLEIATARAPVLAADRERHPRLPGPGQLRAFDLLDMPMYPQHPGDAPLYAILPGVPTSLAVGPKGDVLVGVSLEGAGDPGEVGATKSAENASASPRGAVVVFTPRPELGERTVQGLAFVPWLVEPVEEGEVLVSGSVPGDVTTIR